MESNHPHSTKPHQSGTCTLPPGGERYPKRQRPVGGDAAEAGARVGDTACREGVGGECTSRIPPNAEEVRLCVGSSGAAGHSHKSRKKFFLVSGASWRDHSRARRKVVLNPTRLRWKLPGPAQLTGRTPASAASVDNLVCTVSTRGGRAVCRATRRIDPPRDVSKGGFMQDQRLSSAAG